MSQEGGLSLLLSLAQPPPRSPPTAEAAAAAGDAAGSREGGLAVSGTGDWEVFASAVKLLRQACMLSANRSDLLSLKVI